MELKSDGEGFYLVCKSGRMTAQIYPMCSGSQIFKIGMTRRFRNGITLGIWTQKCFCNCRLNFNFQNSQICPLKALGQKYGKVWGFLGSRTPPMGLYHLVRTTRMGKNQKKRKKKFDPPWCVTLPWFDPYIGIYIHVVIIDEVFMQK